MSTTLSIVLIVNAEQDLRYLAYFLKTMAFYNQLAFEEELAELVIVSQRRDTVQIRSIVDNCFPFYIPVVVPPRDYAADGYPIWDVLNELRFVDKLLDGQFITINHPEFIWTPGSVAATCHYLSSHNNYLVLGNLRRPGPRARIEKEHPGHVVEYSDKLMLLLDAEEWAKLTKEMKDVISCSWMFWNPEPVYGDNVSWLEDVFFVDRNFVTATKLFSHGGRLPFQDVYDLVGIAVLVLEKYGVKPNISRMELAINKIFHLHHPKLWRSWTPAVRDYFLSSDARKKWEHTRFADANLWAQLIKCAGPKNMPKSEQPVFTLRRSPGGTVSRYAGAFERWLCNDGGVSQVKEFYANYLREHDHDHDHNRESVA
jgi:hypothetical protein